MDLTKEALEYLTNECAVANQMTIDGVQFADRDFTPIQLPTYYPQPIQLTTLTSLIEYIASDPDKKLKDGQHILHVESPTRIELRSQLNERSKRSDLIVVKAELPDISYGWMERESFAIQLAASFCDSEDKALLSSFISSVQAGTIAEYGDDGISQKATISKGISGKKDVQVPSRIKLAPFRSFLEIEQPESEFIFRMREEGNQINCRLFEADGGAWKREAMGRLFKFLNDGVSHSLGITILA